MHIDKIQVNQLNLHIIMPFQTSIRGNQTIAMFSEVQVFYTMREGGQNLSELLDAPYKTEKNIFFLE